jgi:lipoyl(octanoyl) transferase
MTQKKPKQLIIRQPGILNYNAAYKLMQDFTAARNSDTPNEIWLTEHPAVITLGTSAKPEHILDAGNTPVVHTDRGGQVTWHGPGQLMVYLLLDLKPLKLTVRSLIQNMEFAAIQMFAEYDIEAKCKANAPGVYVDGSKIASLGIRVKRGCTYHGMAINISNEPDAFSGINPCGYPGLNATRINELLPTEAAPVSLKDVSEILLPHLLRALNLASHQTAFSKDIWHKN